LGAYAVLVVKPLAALHGALLDVIDWVVHHALVAILGVPTDFSLA